MTYDYLLGTLEGERLKLELCIKLGESHLVLDRARLAEIQALIAERHAIVH